MNLGLKGKTAFVGGSGGGIGRAIALEMAREGCNIMLCSRTARVLQELQLEISRTHGVRCEFVAIDLSKPREVDVAVSETLRLFGKADILITNSGGPPSGTFLSLDDARWREAFENTLMHVVRLVRGFLPLMTEQQWGRIINITSVSVKQPLTRLLLSNALRPAVTGFAKTLSDEVASFGVTVNNIAPGYTATDRMEALFKDRSISEKKSLEEIKGRLLDSIPARRFATPTEIAAAALFLASDKAAYITGITLPVDGGMLRSLF